MRYPIVLFDIGETLVGPGESFGATYSRVLRPLGLDIPGELFDLALGEVIGEMARLIPAGIDRYSYFPGGEEEYWLRFARRTLEKTTRGPIEDAFAARSLRALRDAFTERSAWEVYPDVPPTLDALRRAGVRMRVVSNWDSRLPQVLRLLELDRFFEFTGVSHLVGLEKPDPTFFHLVLERMNGRPEEALHVGDTPEYDGAGARAAGIDFMLVDRRDRHGRSSRRFADIADLPRIVVDGLNGSGPGSERPLHRDPVA